MDLTTMQEDVERVTNQEIGFSRGVHIFTTSEISGLLHEDADELLEMSQLPSLHAQTASLE